MSVCVCACACASRTGRLRARGLAAARGPRRLQGGHPAAHPHADDAHRRRPAERAAAGARLGRGAAGGNGGGTTGTFSVGGAGGAAIQGTSRTLNNSGTIYGST